MEDRSQRPAQIDMLRRLTPIELFVLNERCRGMTSEEIGASLDVSDEVSTFYLGNVYDKLGITYQHAGTSMGRLMAFCPVLEDIDAPPVPLRADIDPHAEPPPQHPSERSLDLVEEDDRALRAQRGIDGAAAGAAGGRGWIYGIGAAIAILLVAILAVILLVAGDDDDDEDADATATALAALATPTPEEGEPTPEAGTPTEEAVPTEEPTATPESTPTEEPTETPEPTPTETVEPTPTETVEPTPTEEPTPEPPTATPVPDVTPPPEPQTGTELFAADWSQGPGDWVLANGWSVEDGVLIGEGGNADPIVAPFEPEGADYAIEIVMTVENVEDCDDDPVGPFARINPRQDDDGNEYLAGYIGAVCENEWSIFAFEENEDDLDELESGDFDLDLDDQPHTYRLEVQGDIVRLFVDDEFVGEATDDRYTEPGEVGLYIDGDARAEVEEFTVFELGESS